MKKNFHPNNFNLLVDTFNPNIQKGGVLTVFRVEHLQVLGLKVNEVSVEKDQKDFKIEIVNTIEHFQVDRVVLVDL